MLLAPFKIRHHMRYTRWPIAAASILLGILLICLPRGHVAIADSGSTEFDGSQIPMTIGQSSEGADKTGNCHGLGADATPAGVPHDDCTHDESKDVRLHIPDENPERDGVNTEDLPAESNRHPTEGYMTVHPVLRSETIPAPAILMFHDPMLEEKRWFGFMSITVRW